MNATTAPGRETRLIAKIKEDREARGWSQRELAKRAGVTTSLIGAYEKGSVSPTLRSLAKILDALGVASATDTVGGVSGVTLFSMMQAFAPNSKIEEMPEEAFLAEMLAKVGAVMAGLSHIEKCLRARLEIYGQVIVEKEKRGAA